MCGKVINIAIIETTMQHATMMMAIAALLTEDGTGNTTANTTGR